MGIVEKKGENGNCREEGREWELFRENGNCREEAGE